MYLVLYVLGVTLSCKMLSKQNKINKTTKHFTITPVTGCTGLIADRLQHGLSGGAPLLSHPTAGDGAGSKAPGRLRGGLMDRHPLPDRWPARLHRRRLSLRQVWSAAGHNDSWAAALLLLVSDRSLALNLRHLLRAVRLGAGHLLDSPQHGGVCVGDLSPGLARQPRRDAVNLPGAWHHQGVPPRLPVRLENHLLDLLLRLPPPLLLDVGLLGDALLAGGE